MNAKTLTLAALLAGTAFSQPFGNFTEGRALAGRASERASAAAPSAASLAGFWRGAFVDSVDGLNSFSTRFEVAFSADGRFESRNSVVEPTLYDNRFQFRTDNWKGIWTVKGDSIVLKVEACLVHEGKSVETCEYLEDRDSLVVYHAGLLKKGALKALDFGYPFTSVQMLAASPTAQFILPSLFAPHSSEAAAGPVVHRDRSWALSFGENVPALAYEEPAPDREAAAAPRHSVALR